MRNWNIKIFGGDFCDDHLKSLSLFLLCNSNVLAVENSRFFWGVFFFFFGQYVPAKIVELLLSPFFAKKPEFLVGNYGY